MYNNNLERYNAFLDFLYIMIALFMILTFAMIWKYAHRNYGTRIYALIIMIVVPFLANVVTNYYFSVPIKREGAWPPFLSQVTVIGLISFLGRLIADVLIMAIYQSNRHEEKYVPSFWRFQLFMIIGAFIVEVLAFFTESFNEYTIIDVVSELVKLVTVIIYPAAAAYLWRRSKETLTGTDQPS